MNLHGATLRPRPTRRNPVTARQRSIGPGRDHASVARPPGVSPKPGVLLTRQRRGSMDESGLSDCAQEHAGISVLNVARSRRITDEP